MAEHMRPNTNVGMVPSNKTANDVEKELTCKAYLTVTNSRTASSGDQMAKERKSSETTICRIDRRHLKGSGTQEPGGGKGVRLDCEFVEEVSTKEP